MSDNITPYEKMRRILLALSVIKPYGQKCLLISPLEALKKVKTTEELDFYYYRLVKGR